MPSSLVTGTLRPGSILIVDLRERTSAFLRGARTGLFLNEGGVVDEDRRRKNVRVETII